MEKKRKIKKVAILMENLLYGGVTTHLINLINSKKFKDVKFIIITNTTNTAVKHLIRSCDKNKIKIIYYISLNNFILNNFLLKLLFHIFRPFLFFISIFQMIIILKKINFDTLIGNCGGYGNFRTEVAGILASKILRKKKLNLLIHHNYSKPKIWVYIINIIDFILSKSIKNLIFISHATKKSIIENTKLGNCPKRNLFIIYNGILLKKVKNKKVSYFNSNNQFLKIGMLARIQEYKGQLDLIEGFSRLPKKMQSQYRVYLIGRGSEKDEKLLNFKISSYKLKPYIKHIKYINADSLLILKNLDLYFSLTRDFEGFGYSIAESLYMGVPVVSTKVGGVVEFLNKDNSELINPNDIKSITKILEEFPLNKRKWRKKANLGKKLIIKKFNSEEMSKKIYNVIFSS